MKLVIYHGKTTPIKAVGATCAFIREYDPEYDGDYLRLETVERGTK